MKSVKSAAAVRRAWDKAIEFGNDYPVGKDERVKLIDAGDALQPAIYRARAAAAAAPAPTPAKTAETEVVP